MSTYVYIVCMLQKHKHNSSPCHVHSDYIWILQHFLMLILAHYENSIKILPQSTSIDKNLQISFPDTRKAHGPFSIPKDFQTPTYFGWISFLPQVIFHCHGIISRTPHLCGRRQCIHIHNYLMQPWPQLRFRWLFSNPHI